MRDVETSALAGRLHQCGLPDPRIAEDQERAAATCDTSQQRLHRGDLRVAPDQLWRHHRPPRAEVTPVV
jgi:hypothetical protein